MTAMASLTQPAAALAAGAAVGRARRPAVLVAATSSRRCALPLPPRALATQLRAPGSHAASPARRCRAAAGRAPVRVSAIFGGLEALFKGDPGEKTRQKYAAQVAAVNAFAPAMAAASDEELRAKTTQFRERIKAGASVDSLLPEAFAVRNHTARQTHA
jgi:preprotein translocase subunit SecA